MGKRTIGIIMASLTLGIVAAIPAAADEPFPNDANIWDPAACSDPDPSDFKFHIYYNSGEAGAYRNIGYAVYDFDAIYTTDKSYHALTFCELGVSRPWPGSGQHIKNNAASGDNTHYKYTARVYQRSGYWGNQDAMGPMQHHDQFLKVYNDNASFQWT